MTVKAVYRSDSGTLGVFEREIELRMDMKADMGPASPWIAPALREVRITLQPGQTWPAKLKKGTPIEYEIMGRRFVGVVKRRRMGVLVCWGEFERDATELGARLVTHKRTRQSGWGGRSGG